MYTYETKGNGITLEIFKGEVSISYLQGEEAGFLLDELGEAPDEEVVQYILSQYDY